MTSRFLAVVVLCTVMGTALAAQSPMRPGRWEVTSQMEMANMPMKMPEMKMTQCVTPENLKDPASLVPNASPNAKDKQSCKVSDYKTSGNTMTWKIACSAPQSMTANGEMTFSGDSYTGVMKMVSAQGDMTMKLTGKRLGDCTP